MNQSGGLNKELTDHLVTVSGVDDGMYSVTIRPRQRKGGRRVVQHHSPAYPVFLTFPIPCFVLPIDLPDSSETVIVAETEVIIDTPQRIDRLITQSGKIVMEVQTLATCPSRSIIA